MTDVNVIKYCHLGDKYTNINGKITIASILTDQGVQYGVAYCSPKDRFKKSLGLTIASNRLQSGRCVVNLTQEELSHKNIMVAILCDILETYENPDWSYEMIVDHIDWYNGSNSDLSQEENEKLNIISNVNEFLDNVQLDDSTLKNTLYQYVYDNFE